MRGYVELNQFPERSESNWWDMHRIDDDCQITDINPHLSVREKVVLQHDADMALQAFFGEQNKRALSVFEKGQVFDGKYYPSGTIIQISREQLQKRENNGRLILQYPIPCDLFAVTMHRLKERNDAVIFLKNRRKNPNLSRAIQILPIPDLTPRTPLLPVGEVYHTRGGLERITRVVIWDIGQGRYVPSPKPRAVPKLREAYTM